MDKILTAEELIRIRYRELATKDHGFSEEIDETSLKAGVEWMIEFAKLHVQAALKEAGNIADEWENSGELKPEIINAYPLNNIQ